MQTVAALDIQPLGSGEHAICEAILRGLPEWFGIESSLVQYVRDAQSRPTWIARQAAVPVGFITITRHFPATAEIHCIAVAPTHHRRGVGRRLIEHCEQTLHNDGVRFLQVKTLGPSRPDEFYDRTRRFYAQMGFAPLEEFKSLWPGNPCLQLVKALR